MLTNEDAYKEIEILDAIIADKGANDIQLFKGILKGLTLLIKLSLNHRTNQVLIMKKMGIELVKTPKKDDKEQN